MKICSVCKVEKSLQEFSWKNKKRNIKNSRCKKCQKILAHKHYIKNKLSYIGNLRKNREKNRKLVYDYLKTHSCVDCGESDPVVLEFDHVDSNKKSFNIGSGKTGVGIEKLKQEMEKCVIRCANCHRRKTSKEFNWYRTIT